MSETKMDLVYHELHRWAGQEFELGHIDCILCLSDWIMRVKGVDPAADVRGMYNSPGTCQRETGFLRDPVGAIDRQLATIGGLDKTDAPARGDVAVIMVNLGGARPEPCGAMWLGNAWACKGERGTTTRDPSVVRVLAIWSVGYEA